MQTIAVLNVLGLIFEVVGVAILLRIDFTTRSATEAQANLQKAHDAYLQNMNNDPDGHYERLRNRPEDRRLVDSYDPRASRAGFRFALWLIGVGMAIQLVAAIALLLGSPA